MNQTEAIDKAALLKKANEMMTQHEHYFTGLTATDVEQKGDVLVFRGDYFLDEQGLPGEKSTAAFNVFKFLAVALSSRYHLQE
ncbi:DUF2498 family protein [Erwinia endophytica]|uniref:DUF2498 family protein n=1 Tax=Erwinia endophytica TaxID=1563158 RepID=UPI001265DD3A|nr:DUF2498 family protein [Erwinia endophytica]KAB8313617.1 DUF2498 family protein [Erwinia endophytica]